MEAKPQSREDFYQDVYAVVQMVPKGRVTSYGAIAAFLSRRGAARMVGYALNALGPDQRHKVPAHRVVNRSGLLTGKNYFGEPDKMAELLEAEGIKVVNDKVQNFAALHWEPIKEL